VPIESVCDDTLDYNGTLYYIVDDYSSDDEIIAVSSETKPDSYGRYTTVKLLMSGDEITGIEESDQEFNSTDNELE